MSNRLSVTEPDGNTTNYTYDALNRQLKMVNAAGDTTVTTYDPVGNVACRAAPNSNVTCYTYDALNRVIKETDSQGPVQTTTYDPVGNVTSQLDGNGNGPDYAYDADNRITTMTDALGKPTQYTYDNVGNQLSVTDRNGNLTSYTYDKINRRISTTDAQPATTTYKYDNVGNLIKLTDPNLHSTSYTYDKVNRRLTETYPDLTHNTVTYTYDAVGNRMARTDQKSQTTTYTYSDLYFLLQRSYPVTAADVFTYDLSGRMLTATKGSWAESYAYDGGDRIVQSDQNSRVISYAYNIPGRMRTVTYPGGSFIAEQLDYRSQLSTVNDGGVTPIAQYTYDPAERELTRTYRNGTVAKYSYNANNWVTSLTHMMGSNLIVGFNYAFDNEGNKNYEQKLHENTHSEGYSYDNVYRLVNYQVGTLVGSTITMVITQTAYNLDPLANWKSKTTDMVTQTRTHSPSNEITKINSTPILSDFNGNTSDDGTNLYSYDEENRLVQVTAKATHAVLGLYQYDALGRRISRVDNFGVQTLYYYDDRRSIEEQSSTGMTQATYVFGNYVDEALMMDRTGQSSPLYYHQNTVWSLYALSDSTGKGIEGYSYDAYGYQTIALPGADGILWTADDVILPGGKSAYGNPLLFTEQHLDPEGGLYFFRARYHNPLTGRFMQRDPMEYVDGVNLYEYVKSSPANYADWQGQQSFTVARGSTRCALGEMPTPGRGQGAFVVRINHEECDRHCTEAHEETHVADEKPCCEKAREAYQKAGTPAERNAVVGRWNEYATANRNYTECRAHTCGARCLEQLIEQRSCNDCLSRARSDDPATRQQGLQDVECCRYLRGFRNPPTGRVAQNEEYRRDYCSRADANVDPPCPFAEQPPMRARDPRGEAKGGLGCFVGSARPRGNGDVRPGEAHP